MGALDFGRVAKHQSGTQFHIKRKGQKYLLVTVLLLLLFLFHWKILLLLFCNLKKKPYIDNFLIFIYIYTNIDSKIRGQSYLLGVTCSRPIPHSSAPAYKHKLLPLLIKGRRMPFETPGFQALFKMSLYSLPPCIHHIDVTILLTASLLKGWTSATAAGLLVLCQTGWYISSLG